MITRGETHHVDLNKNMRGGEGTIKITHFMNKEDAEGHGRLFAKIEIPVGGSIGVHDHQGEFETFYIIGGEGIIVDNGEEVKVNVGDFHKCASGSSHGVINTGSEPLVMIALIMSAQA
ncbi:MAG: cupin domain-containing protein [Lachnospiraceae bacterium]|nr:cupin domain-containing protein [Lachnospiraceae bacterium]